MSDKLVDVTAQCGHVETALVPHFTRSVGAVGRRNIEAAQARDCFPCRKAQQPVELAGRQLTLNQRVWVLHEEAWGHILEINPENNEVVVQLDEQEEDGPVAAAVQQILTEEGHSRAYPFTHFVETYGLDGTTVDLTGWSTLEKAQQDFEDQVADAQDHPDWGYGQIAIWPATGGAWEQRPDAGVDYLDWWSLPQLASYDAVVISSSAGKDSLAMMSYLSRLAEAQCYPKSKMLVVHADLGKVEWPGTRELAEEQANYFGIRFEAVSRRQGDLLQQVEERGMWPSPKIRYCTSDQKRDQIGRIYTLIGKDFSHLPRRSRILSCIGFTFEESPARAKHQQMEVNQRASNKSREVTTWLPIQKWTVEQVWAEIRASGAPSHPAYDLGMPRLSCVFCIYAPKAVLVLAGQHNRELLDTYVALEAKIDHTFKKDLSMAQVRAEVECLEATGAVVDTAELTSWRM